MHFIFKLAATFIFLFSYFLPWLFVPGELDVKQINDTYKVYKEGYDKFLAQPKPDKEAHTKLLGEFKTLYEKHDLENLKRQDFLDETKTKKFEEGLDEFAAVFQRFDILCEGGLVAGDVDKLLINEDDITEVLSIDWEKTKEKDKFAYDSRALMQYLVLVAEFYKTQGDWPKLRKTYERMYYVIEPLWQGYNTANSMTGVAVNQMSKESLLRSLLILENPDLLFVRNMLMTQASPLDSGKRVMIGYLAGKADFLTYENAKIISQASSDEYDIMTRIFDSSFFALIGKRYFKRERLIFCHIMQEAVESFDELKKGVSLSEINNQFDTYHGTLSIILVFDFVSMRKRSFDAHTLNRAVLKTLDVELARRQSGGALPYEIPVDEKRKILVSENGGEIVEIEKLREASNNAEKQKS